MDLLRRRVEENRKRKVGTYALRFVINRAKILISQTSPLIPTDYSKPYYKTDSDTARKYDYDN